MNKMVKEINGRLIVTDVTGYREATQEDLAKLEQQKADGKARSEIAQLKRKLQATDYHAIKFAEGEMSADEYEPIKSQRSTWRIMINELEDRLCDTN